MPVSDKWLRSFVAAVDAGSLTAAARSLGVGQPAVSHAVARLERELGVSLFDRSGQRMTLTAAGSALYDRTSAALVELDAAVDAARWMESNGVVTLSVSTSLASHWLLPRLPEFKRRHPEIELRLITTDSDAHVGNDDADLWIPLGPTARPGLVSQVFRVEEMIPVATPALTATLSGSDPADLADGPLLHLEERYENRYDWWRWFADHGVDAPTSLAGYRSNDYSLVLQAALDGQGIALGWRHIVGDLIDDGRLVGLAEPVETNRPFLIVHRVGAEQRSDVMALRDWLVSA